MWGDEDGREEKEDMEKEEGHKNIFWRDDKEGREGKES